MLGARPRVAETMAWAKPLYSRTRVTNAGFEYIDPATTPEEREIALAVINNWRTSHHYPLNTLQIYLRRQARQYDDDPTVAQRIKRLPSIRHKLERFNGMELARMQDIGGCRAVLSSVAAVDELVGYFKPAEQDTGLYASTPTFVSRRKAATGASILSTATTALGGRRGTGYRSKYRSARGSSTHGPRLSKQSGRSPSRL
jgi:hypothetical protein